jgi:hypothetical protein
MTDQQPALAVDTEGRNSNGQDNDGAKISQESVAVPGDDSRRIADVAKSTAPQVVAATVQPPVAYEDTQPDLPVIRQPDSREERTAVAEPVVEANKQEVEPATKETPVPSMPKPAEPAAGTEDAGAKPQGRLLPWEAQRPAATEKSAGAEQIQSKDAQDRESAN